MIVCHDYRYAGGGTLRDLRRKCRVNNQRLAKKRDVQKKPALVGALMAEALGGTGQTETAMHLIDDSLAQTEKTEWGERGRDAPPASLSTVVPSKGREGDGLIQFTGTFNSLTWTGANREFWNGVTVGATGLPVPEPATWGVMLLGFGLALTRVLRRYR
jgi:hypothetical protein